MFYVVYSEMLISKTVTTKSLGKEGESTPLSNQRGKNEKTPLSGRFEFLKILLLCVCSIPILLLSKFNFKELYISWLRPSDASKRQ